MPYISKDERKQFEDFRIFLRDMPALETKGNLEYLIFLLMKKYMSSREQKYSELHNVCYAAQHCCDEFRRRYLDKREDSARTANGDVE